MLPAQGEPTAADLDEAGRAATEHLDTATDADAEFAKPANPARLAGYVAHFGPLTRAQTFER